MQKCRSLKIKVDQQSTARQQCLPKRKEKNSRNIKKKMVKNRQK